MYKDVGLLPPREQSKFSYCTPRRNHLAWYYQFKIYMQYYARLALR